MVADSASSWLGVPENSDGMLSPQVGLGHKVGLVGLEQVSTQVGLGYKVGLVLDWKSSPI